MAAHGKISTGELTALQILMAYEFRTAAQVHITYSTEHKMPVFPDSTVMLKAILMIMPVLTARLYKNCNYRHIIVREQNLSMKLF